MVVHHGQMCTASWRSMGIFAEGRITAGPGAVQGGGSRAGAGRAPGHWRSGGLLPRCEGAGQPPGRPLRRSCREAAARWSGARSPCGRRRCWRDGDGRQRGSWAIGRGESIPSLVCD